MSEVSEDVCVINLRSRRVVASLPGLVRYLRKYRPDALISALSHANVIAVLAHGMARIPAHLVLGERSTPSRSMAQARSLRERCVVPLMRHAYRRAHAIVAVSGGVADDLVHTIGLPREHIDVVYNPVVTPDLEVKASAPVDHPWFGEGQPPVILAVGRLTPAKDYPTLLRAFARIRRRRDCRLLILGEGELRTSLEVLIDELGIRDSVQMPGFAENPFALMRAASLFVLSSAWEGLPNVLIQAMACGAPVISTDCPSGPSEILEGGKWGALVPVGDDAELAAAIEEGLNGNGVRDAQERASSFNIDNAIDAYLQILNDRVA